MEFTRRPVATEVPRQDSRRWHDSSTHLTLEVRKGTLSDIVQSLLLHRTERRPHTPWMDRSPKDDSAAHNNVPCPVTPACAHLQDRRGLSSRDVLCAVAQNSTPQCTHSGMLSNCNEMNGRIGRDSTRPWTHNQGTDRCIRVLILLERQGYALAKGLRMTGTLGMIKDWPAMQNVVGRENALGSENAATATENDGTAADINDGRTEGCATERPQGDANSRRMMPARLPNTQQVTYHALISQS